MRITTQQQQKQIYLQNEYNSSVEDVSKNVVFVPSDNFVKTEAQIQRRLPKLNIDGSLLSEMYNKIRTTGSRRLRIDGFPKTHKPNASLCPSFR